MAGAFIYILRCSDGSYYTCITRRSVEERVSEHEQGLQDSTLSLGARDACSRQYYERIDDAVGSERRIKGWSRAKKEAYMRGNFPALMALSRRRAKRQL